MCVGQSCWHLFNICRYIHARYSHKREFYEDILLFHFRNGNYLKICILINGKYFSIPAHSGFSARLSSLFFYENKTNISFAWYFACAFSRIFRMRNDKFCAPPFAKLCYENFFRVVYVWTKEKKVNFLFFLSADRGGGQSLAEMFANKSRFFYSLPYCNGY